MLKSRKKLLLLAVSSLLCVLLYVVTGVSRFEPEEGQLHSKNHSASGAVPTVEGESVQSGDGQKANFSKVYPPRQQVVQSWRSDDKPPMLVQNGVVMPERQLIKRVLSETWLDAENKAVRKRIRVVEANFKYPRLRLEEDVTKNKAGEQISTLVKASVADHVMVGLKEGVSVEAANEAMTQQGIVVRAIESGSYLLVKVDDFTDSEAIDRQSVRLENLKDVVQFAEPDYLVYPCVVPNDPAFTQKRMWAMENLGEMAQSVEDADIDAYQAWDIRTSASNIVVAVTDTGIRYTHEDLAANMWQHPSTSDYGMDAYDDDDDPMDLDGHGTHCAGIIGAKGGNGVGAAGVAWDVQLMACRFLGPNGGTTSDAVRVINYARENGADIISASWGGAGESLALKDAIKACYAEDIPFVAAAGNSASNIDMMAQFPASFSTPNIVGVASTDNQDRLSVFSNFGRIKVDIAAPGTDIWSCGAASDSDYKYLSGTSMATPHVAGALALARAQFPGETAEESIARLYSTVDPLAGLENEVATGGRINLHRLLTVSSKGTPHDDFNNPWVFSGCHGYWCGYNTNATREVDEDSFSPNTGDRSLWFTWVAPDDGYVNIDAKATKGDLSMVLFEGEDRNSLSRLRDNFSQRTTNFSAFSLYVEEGKRYYLSVDSRTDIDQLMIVHLWFRPANDNIANAVVIPDQTFSVEGSNCSATEELFERDLPHSLQGKGHSVWWKWTADFDGEYVVTTAGTKFDTVLGVYDSNAGQLSAVGVNDDRNEFDYTSQVTFTAEAGVTYWFVVDGYRDYAMGDIVLSGFKKGELVVLYSSEDAVAEAGEWADFEVHALSDRPLQYFWSKDGIRISYPPERDTLYLRPVRSSSYGEYTVEITDGDTSIFRNWTLKAPEIKPKFTKELEDRVVIAGGLLRLTPQVTGSQPMTYQWQKDGVDLPGEIDIELNIESVNSSDEGAYRLVATNAFGESSMNDVVVVVQQGSALRWVQRLPRKDKLDFTDGISWNGKIHLVTYDGLWLSGQNVDSLKVEPLESFRRPIGLTVHGNSLVVYGAEGSNFNTSAKNKLMIKQGESAWSKITTSWPSTGVIRDLESDGTTAVASVDGALLYSNDLQTWSAVSGVTRDNYEGLCYNGEKFVAFRKTSSSDAERMQWAVSADGINWTEYSDTVSLTSRKASHFTTANGLFFMYGGYPDKVSVSTDGVTWTHNLTGYSEYAQVVWRDGVYYQSGGASSTDGYTWHTVETDMKVASVFFMHNGNFIRAGSNYGDLYTRPFITESPEILFAEDPSLETIPTMSSLVNLGRSITSFSTPAITSVDGVEWGLATYYTGARNNQLKPLRAVYSGEDIWAFAEYVGSSSGASYLFCGPTAELMEEVTKPALTTGYYAYTGFAANGSDILLSDAVKTWISHDKGQTWNVSASVAGIAGSKDVVSVADGFVVAIGSSIRVSFDGGVTWGTRNISLATSSGKSDVVKMSVSGEQVVILDGAGYLHVSGNAGDTWSRYDLGETGWKSVAQNNGSIYILHQDGRVGNSSTGASFAFDSQLNEYGTGNDLVSYNGALFALIGNKLLQAGEVDALDIDLQLSGIMEQGIYDAGESLALKWSSVIEKGEISSVEVYLDGVLQLSTTDLSGITDLVIPGEGSHTVQVVVHGVGGQAVTERRVLYSRGDPMKLIVSYERKNIMGITEFAGTVYAAIEDGRILRSVDGVNWDLAMWMPSKPEMIIASDRSLVVAGKQAIVSTSDGIKWHSRGTKELWTNAYDKGFAIGVMRGTVQNDTIIIQATGCGFIYSEDGINWSESPISISFTGAMSLVGESWIGVSNPGSYSAELTLSYKGAANIELGGVLGGHAVAAVSTEDTFYAATDTALMKSEDGKTWEHVCDTPIWIKELINVDGRIFARTSSNIPADYQYLDGNALVNISTLPDAVIDGVWWSGSKSSTDGVNWETVISGSTKYTTEAIVNGIHFVSWKTNAGSTSERTYLGVVGENGAVTEVDLNALFLEQNAWSSTTDVPRMSVIDDEGTLHTFGANYATRTIEGQWSTLSSSPRHPKLYVDGKYYAYSSSLSGFFLYVASDLNNWQTITMPFSSSTDGYAADIKVYGSDIYYQTQKNVYKSVDGGYTWQLYYESATAGYGYPVAVAQFNDEVLVMTANSNAQPVSKNGGSWAPVANGVYLSGFGGSTMGVYGGKLNLLRGTTSYITADLTNWEKVELVAGSSGASLNTMLSGPYQGAVTYRHGSRYYTYTTNKDGEWQERQEIDPLQSGDVLTGGNGTIVQHRSYQLWMESGNDLAIGIAGVTTSDVALNVPIQVELKLSNRQVNDFIPSDESVIRIWAAPDGVLNYKERILLKTIPLMGVNVAADTTESLTSTVELPSETPPGKYHIVAELVDLSGSHVAFDDIGRNNWAKSKEELSLQGHSLLVNTVGNGNVQRDHHNVLYARGARVSLSATVGKGAVFSGWQGDAYGAQSQITMLMDDDKSVVANFTGVVHLQIQVKGGGVVSGASADGSYAVGAMADLTAEPNDGWVFDGWELATTGSNTSASILMDQSKTLVAKFAQSVASWKGVAFTSEEQANTLISGDNADPDGDGLPNWKEYLHGTDPKNGKDKGVKSSKVEGDYLTVVFTRNSAVTSGYALECKASRNMSDWNASDIEMRVISEINGVETIEARIPVSGGDSGFIQMNYVVPDNN